MSDCLDNARVEASYLQLISLRLEEEIFIE
jgi:hypothetical protein